MNLTKNAPNSQYFDAKKKLKSPYLDHIFYHVTNILWDSKTILLSSLTRSQVWLSLLVDG
jgi:hypothetical protein